MRQTPWHIRIAGTMLGVIFFVCAAAGNAAAQTTSNVAGATTTAASTTAAVLPSSIATSASSSAVNVYYALSPNTTLDFSTTAFGEFLAIVGLIVLAPFFIGAFRQYGGKNPQPRKYIGYGLVGVGLILLGIGTYYGTTNSRIPLTFSTKAMSASAWEAYKTDFLDPTSGRVVDASQGNITTSEGESYAMLRSVWIDDQKTFDMSWNWTSQFLARPTDHLFAWKYGQVSPGTYGIMTAQGGNNTATDADSDIALALVMAYDRWQDPKYLNAARLIISDIWNNEVVIINGKPYLGADNLEKTSSSPYIVVNPSYFSPYSYRIFAKLDPTHPWSQLTDNMYTVLDNSMTSNLDRVSSANIPPDWIQVNRTTGVISAINQTTNTTNYSYDAMRTPWRLALDWQWNKEDRAKQLLSHMGFFSTQWRQNGLVEATYQHDGYGASQYEAPAIYGGTIGYFLVNDPTTGADVYRQKLLVLFDPDTNTWREPLGYYDANWVWFGMALYNNQLPNLAQTLPATRY